VRSRMLARLSRSAPALWRHQRGLCTLPAEAPIALFGVAGRYATAIYTAAAKKKELEAVEGDLKMLSDTMAASAPFKAYVTDPGVPRAAKASKMIEIMTAAGASGTTKNAMATLAESGRMGEVSKIIGMYGDLMNAAKGEVTAVITSPAPLSAAEEADVKAKLATFLEPGQTKVKVEVKVNPGLIQGITIEIGDKFIDYSVATQLKKIVSLIGIA